MTRFMLSAAGVALLSGAPLTAQTKATAENVLIIPHTSVPNFFKLPPDLYFGEGIGIATNSKGHIFVYHRSGQGQFNIVHGIASDAQGNVYVGDEGNKRVQVFDTEGTFKTQFTNVGAPTALCLTRGPQQVLYVAHTGGRDGGCRHL
ncbi:MAG TPA: hypothetical protein VFO48_09015 [Vicinamibacterales bacterium]|nr:hypothetical protein [Vicinamibacterales bacterium]